MKKRQVLLRLLLVCATLKCLLAERKTLSEISDDPVIMETNNASNRKLFGVCQDGSKPIIHYFEVIVRIQPDMSVTGVCTLADQMKLGSDINSILSSHAIGDSGIDQTLKFKAAVCTIPVESTRRALQVATFLWKGGGGCRGCPCDCRDGRRDLQFAVWGTTEWFNDIYAPQLEASIFNAIVTNVVPSHPKCLGQVPFVTVEVTKLTLIQLLSRFQCQGGKVISLLDTMSLTSIAVIDRMCDNCVTIDFSKTREGIPLQDGTDISQQWQMDGLTIEASGVFKNTPTTARILDTSNSECLEEVNAQEFGSPNRSCPNRGPGWGSGGSIGTEGENCRPLGNVLVAQDIFFDSDDCPRPSVFGGKLSLIFETPVFFHDLGVLDMHELDSSLQLTYSDNVVEFFSFSRFGVNAVQRVIISKPNVKKLELAFGLGSSAVTEISFCRVCEAKTGHDDKHDCIVAGNVVNKVSEIIEVNNFEEQNQAVALKGWQNGQIDISQIDAFSKFLGKYTATMNAPYKVFSVPRDADAIIVELDFYEIDGWDLQDSIAIFVDGEQISMQFNHAVDEGRREGMTQLGVKWTSVSTDLPQNLGFLNFMDQKHHIILEVPSSSKLYSDGEIRILLSCVARQSATLSAGWDNIIISVRHGCPLINALNAPAGSSNSNPMAVAAGGLAVSPTLKPTNPLSNPFTKQPTAQLSTQPTRLPTRLPTNQPTRQPTQQPIIQPIKQPTRQPTKLPTNQPTRQPTNQPTRQPTNQLTRQPTNQPIKQPTNRPTRQPTNKPSRQPTRLPTLR